MKRGSIDQLPSGRWRVRVPSGRGQKTWGTFDTEPIAERELVKALKSSDDSRRDYEGLTVNELGKRVLTRREVKHEVRDPNTDWSRWDRHVKPDEIGKLAVAKVQPKHVHQWLLRLRDKGLSVQTVRNCRNLLSVVLGEACQAGTIRQNPCADVRMRAPRVSTEAGWTYLVPDEQRALLMALPLPERCIVAFAIGTGLRAGELCALHRVDVDAERWRLLVRFGRPPEEPTKTGRVRPVVILGPAGEALQRWIAEMNPPAGGPLFPLGGGRTNRYGVYRDPDHVIDWKVWKAALKSAGLTRRVRWHDLRHTCASSLVSGWWGRRWSLQEVKELLGHTTIDITQRYAHLAPDALEEAARGTHGGAMTLGAHALEQGNDPRDTPQGESGAPGPGERRANGPPLSQVTLVTCLPESLGKIVATESAKLLPESSAPPTRVERATNGLGIRRSPELERLICGNDLYATREQDDGPRAVLHSTPMSSVRSLSVGDAGAVSQDALPELPAEENNGSGRSGDRVRDRARSRDLTPAPEGATREEREDGRDNRNRTEGLPGIREGHGLEELPGKPNAPILRAPGEDPAGLVRRSDGSALGQRLHASNLTPATLPAREGETSEGRTARGGGPGLDQRRHDRGPSGIDSGDARLAATALHRDPAGGSSEDRHSYAPVEAHDRLVTAETPSRDLIGAPSFHWLGPAGVFVDGLLAAKGGA